MRFIRDLASDVSDDPKALIVWGSVCFVVFSVLGIGGWIFIRPVALLMMSPLICIGVYMIACGVIDLKKGD
jgi:hypothetical protein